MNRLSRRSMLQLCGMTAAGAIAGKGFGNARPSTVVLMMRPAEYSAVTLLDGPMREQFRAQHATLLAMDEDALLKPFRQAAGLAAPGEDLGGWYSASADFNPPDNLHGYIPGHSFGQYVSSLARAYAVTGHEPTRQKVLRLNRGLAPAITPKFYSGYPLPAYTFDKINVGLIDAHAYAGDASALSVLDLATDAALPHLPEKALTRPEMAARPHPNISYTWDESYTLPENLYLAWRRGAGGRYRTLAARFLLDGGYFDPLARGENVLPGKHAYSHVNALSSAMQAYLVDGNPKHLAAAKNGFDFVQAQSYATGGWGPDERFFMPGSGALGNSLSSTHSSFETPCGAYGHFKIARYLMSVTGDSRYGDSMERVLYNTVLGALPMKPDGTAFYYSDYNDTGAKTYYDLNCSCCSGTLGQIVADYGISSYFLNERGAVVNLYVPSRFHWKQGGSEVSIEQATSYPLDSATDIVVRTAKTQTFSISLRIPAWAGIGTTLMVNGKRAVQAIVPGRFLEIRRTWSDADRITLVLDAKLRLESVDEQHPDLVAAMHGPLALFAVGDRFLPFKRHELMAMRHTSPQASEWRVQTVDGVQRFKPFFSIQSTPTRLYQTVSSQASTS